MSRGPWIGVDLDGTLAEYHGWTGKATTIGPPIQPMLERVKNWLAQGKKVKIMTARISHDFGANEAREEIEAWCLEHVGQVLEVTCVKDYFMIELWDDRAVRVQANVGHPCCEHHEVKPSYHKIT